MDHSPHKIPEDDFLRLFVRHEPALRAFARVQLPDSQTVDDVMQEASVVMWRKLGQLENEDGFLPWAKVIVRYESMLARRKASRDRLVLSDRVTEMLAEEAEQATVDEWELERAAMRSCLGKFSDEHRQLLVAPYQEGGSVKKLAERAGKTPNSLYKLLGRLREQLAQCVRLELKEKL